MTVVETGTTSIVDVLRNIGVDVTNAGEREIQGRCPVHLARTGRADKSPSWSMNASSGAWICFSCGARGSLMGLVQELTGSDQPALEFYSTVIMTSLENIKAPVVQHKPEVDWTTYSKFDEVPESELSSRFLTRKYCNQFGIRWDAKNDCWIIPIMDKDRNLLGWQSKKPGWVRNYPVGIKKSQTLFGIERFRSDTAILVESPLDVVRLASLESSFNGLASFGSAVSNTQINLLSAVSDRVVIAMDNDEAGTASSMKLYKSLPRFRKGVLWLNYKNTTAKDIGEMTDEEIKNAIETATAIPGWLL